MTPGTGGHDRPLGVVLAGGAATRMGADKAAVRLAGRRLIDHVLDAVTAAGLEPLVAGPPRPDIAAAFVADPPELAGPAAGLVAAMRAAPGRDVVLVGTDQPYLRAETLRRLEAHEGDLIAPLDGRCQTLCAVYRATAVDQVERLVAARPNPSLQSLFDAPAAVRIPAATWRTWGEDGRSWLSLDTPAALARAEAAWPEPPAGTIGA